MGGKLGTDSLGQFGATMLATQSPREHELRGHGTRRYQLPMHGDSNPKLCECGCGEPAPLAKMTNTRRGHVRGQPTRFLVGHAMRGKRSGNWKGGRVISSRGYVFVFVAGGYALEHRLVMSEALGRNLGPGEHVHHINGNRLDNCVENLLVLTRSQHTRIHNLMSEGTSHSEAVRIVMGSGVNA